MKSIYPLLSVALFAVSANAAEPAAVSAKDLAAKLGALQVDGSSFVRLKMDVKPAGGAPKSSLQLQIKQRRTANSTELVYQVLWPKERAGESVLLKLKGNQFSGAVFTPPDTLKILTASQIKDPLFGSALTYADVLENFFTWDEQKIVGTEVVNKVNCQILESRAGKGGAIVRSWIDMRRSIPMRVEKYLSSGAASRRIDTAQVVSDDLNRNLPAYLNVWDLQKGSSTEVDGSKLKHGVKYTDREFTPEGLKEVTTPRSE